MDGDLDYRTGKWDGDDDDYQWSRYAIVGAIVRQSGARNVLDIGCSDGLLLKFLEYVELESYVGLDISQSAVDTASSSRPLGRFVCADVECWEPDGTYDAIVLNEVVYYLRDIDAALRKLQTYLKSNGVIISSVFKHPRIFSPNHRALRKVLSFYASEGYELVADLEIEATAAVKRRWTIVAARKPRAA